MGNGIVKGLAHIGVFVRDMDVSLDFYRRLGFALDHEVHMGSRMAFLSAGSCLLELIEQKGGAARPAGVVDHIAVEVDDIDAAIAAAQEKGIAIDAAQAGSAPILGGIKNIFFDGPDGERLEFFAYCHK